jgi:hypothetical protein
VSSTIAPASPTTIVATLGGLALGAYAAHRMAGPEMDVTQLVPGMVIGGIVGYVLGQAWQPTSSGIVVNAGAPNNNI